MMMRMHRKRHLKKHRSWAMNNFFSVLLTVFFYCLFVTNSYAESNIKELKTSLKKVEVALESDPDNIELIWGYAGINFELGHVTKELGYLKVASEQYNNLHSLMPDNPRVLLAAYSANYAYIWSGGTTDISALKNIFNKVDNETKKTLSPPSTVQLLARIGFPQIYGDHLRTEEQKHDIYTDSLRNGIKEQPDYTGNYRMLSNLYARKEQYLLAIAIAKQGLNKSPERAENHYSIGKLYMQKVWADGCTFNNDKELKYAETNFLNAIKLQPATALFHREIAKTYESQKRGTLALNSAKKAVSLNNDFETLSTLASIEMLFGSKEKALDSYNLISELHGKDEGLYGKRSLAAYQADFRKAYKLTKLNEHSNVYDYLDKGMYGDQAKKKKGSLYFAKKALNDTNIQGRQRQLAEFIVGRIDYEELVSTNVTSCDELEAHFYNAYKKMQQGDLLSAKEQFEKTLEFGFQSFHEHQMAGYFLNKLN